MVDTATIQSTDTGPTLEQEAAAQESAAAVVENKEPVLSGEEVTEERPEWLPEKFKSVEDMAKAYSALEGKLGSGEEVDPEAGEVSSEEAADEAVSKAGLDMSALEAEFTEAGELSEASMKALADVGIPKEMVDTYINAQTSQAEAVKTELLSTVGGEEAYGEMLEWASDALDDGEIDAFNSVIGGSDVAATKMALENLKTRFVAANGSEPQVTLTGKATASVGTSYESVDALMKDMGNPEYHTNESFRAKVAEKLARSSIM